MPDRLPDAAPPRTARRRFLWPALCLLVALLLLELSVRVAMGLGLLPRQSYPVRGGGPPVYMDDLDPLVGVWRHPNARTETEIGGRRIAFRSNAAGARDRERSPAGKGRVLVLGDSYAEGWGVPEEARFSNLLEDATGREFLNFGVSGNFGPLQEALLYEREGARHEHDAVLLTLLPFNDFSDMRPGDFPPRRYRPYPRRAGDGFEPWYPVPFAERDRGGGSRLAPANLKNELDNRVALLNALRWGTRRVKEALRAGREPAAVSVPPYDRHDAEDLARLRWCLERLAARAAPRPLHVFLIPASDDLRWALVHGAEALRLPGELAVLGVRYPNLVVHDLAPAFLGHMRAHGLRDDASFTIRGDGHWDEEGHRIAAAAMQAALRCEMVGR